MWKSWLFFKTTIPPPPRILHVPCPHSKSKCLFQRVAQRSKSSFLPELGVMLKVRAPQKKCPCTPLLSLQLINGCQTLQWAKERGCSCWEVETCPLLLVLGTPSSPTHPTGGHMGVTQTPAVYNDWHFASVIGSAQQGVSGQVFLTSGEEMTAVWHCLASLSRRLLAMTYRNCLVKSRRD